jgi:hypothetical protein
MIALSPCGDIAEHAIMTAQPSQILNNDSNNLQIDAPLRTEYLYYILSSDNQRSKTSVRTVLGWVHSGAGGLRHLRVLFRGGD